MERDHHYSFWKGSSLKLWLAILEVWCVITRTTYPTTKSAMRVWCHTTASVASAHSECGVFKWTVTARHRLWPVISDWFCLYIHPSYCLFGFLSVSRRCWEADQRNEREIVGSHQKYGGADGRGSRRGLPNADQPCSTRRKAQGNIESFL